MFDFEAEQIDAAIHIGQPDWPGASCTFLMTETVEPMCSPQLLEEHPVESPLDLGALTLLHLASRPGAWDHWFESLRLQTPPSRSMRFEQFSTAAQACMAGLGVALLPRFLVAAEIESGALVPAYPHPVVSPSAYYLVAPKAKSERRPSSRSASGF